MRAAIAVWIVIVVSLFPISEVKADPPSVGCQAVSIAIGAAVGYGGVISLGGTAASLAGVVSPAVTAYLGAHALSQPCDDLTEAVHDHLELISESMGPVDYQEFVENHCGGNPYNCAPLNTSGDPFGDPNPWNQQCYWSIDCTTKIMLQTKPQGFSVNDLISAGTFIDYSLYSGSWQFTSYGYLIGYSDPTPPPGHTDPY